jgi:hypothetical protein
MDIYILLILRLIHVVAGILWGGSAIFLLFFVKPSVKAIGASGPQFMQSLVERRKAPLFMVGSSFLTVVSGGILYWFSSAGFKIAWISTGPGIGFTIGAFTGLVAFLFGNFGIGPTSEKLGKLGAQIAASGKPPSPEQVSQLQALEKRLNFSEQVDFIMMVIAMLTMATARYWIF